MRFKFAICLALLGTFLPITFARADELDDFITAQMTQSKIPGLSLAIINDGRILKVKGYGVCDKGTSDPVKPSTLFMAGSVSKSVTAFGALHLVETGKIDLDKPINDVLTTWKVPDNQFTVDKKPTLREILSHQAGFNVHGFGGYAVGAPRPTLLEVLKGEKPANSPPIRVTYVPGTKSEYSGGGITVEQMAIVDVALKRFPPYMEENVLKPLGMNDSTFEQPLPPAKQPLTATGYYSNGSQVPGRWHIYPEMAAAGLWTTATDLAKFIIGVQQSYVGASNPVTSMEITHQMLTNQKASSGLGVFLESGGANLRFTHDGVDEGFDTLYVAYATQRKGAVIMINCNDPSGASLRIMKKIAQVYDWPGY